MKCWKRKYKSFTKANAAIARGSKIRKHFRGTKLNAYRCENCGYWHIGNKYSPKMKRSNKWNWRV